MNGMTAIATRTRTARLVCEAGIAAGLAGLTALAAQVRVPLPGTPVPATLQVAAVIFAGAAAGPWRGLASQLLYLALGLCGLPVFAGAGAAGPAAAAAATFGYLLAFPPAAFLAGRFTGRARWLGSFLGLAVIYLLGVGWLQAWAALSGGNASLAWALLAGLWPFVIFDVLKAALATWSAGPLRRRLS
ncbi:MAG: biotin transporter BioY [Deltaproteobacteria bacterium]|nr:MAG: biotin transporter BioY [Deltaproteobacteria bacterium]